MYVVALALSVAVAACATQSHPTEVPRTAVLPANALHRCKATHDRQDCLTAFRELLPLAQQGYASAQNNLGLMYAEGRGIAKDDTEAVRWYRQAAAQGNAYAYANLGQMYEQGRGVPRDLVEAQRWYAKAAELLPPGSEGVAAIVARNRVERQLTANQVPVSQPAAVTPPTPISASPPAPVPRPALSNGAAIPLVNVGGVYELPVEINGRLTLNFVFDSGAAEMNIPVDVVSTLIRTGTITNTDFLPEKTYILADGSQQSSPRFVIRSVKIGHQSIPNVSASIGNINSGLLIGQSLLEKLGTWGVDTQRQVLIVLPR